MWNSVYFQESNSPSMEHLSMFQDHSMIIITSITFIVFSFMLFNYLNPNFNHFIMENQEIEMFWTILPSITLLFIASPSMKILYLMEEMKSPSISIKASGFQWYWSHEILSNENESFMKKSNFNRLMSSSNSIVVPTNTPIKVISTSNDVIHSWTIPSLGIKSDAVPGRLNQMISIINFPSIMKGQCSEICGANHSFMPISMKSVPSMKFTM